MRFAGLINAIEQLSAQAKGRKGLGSGEPVIAYERERAMPGPSVIQRRLRLLTSRCR
jgi:hypothetical protein